MTDEKLYVLRIPNGIDTDSYCHAVYFEDDDSWRPNYDYMEVGQEQDLMQRADFLRVTQAQIDEAPAWVKALDKVEVREDERTA